MSLPKKLKMALAAAFTVGMIFTGTETVSAAPATSLGQSAGTVQELLGSDVQEARARGVRIPTKSARYSNSKPATYSDLKPAGVPTRSRPPGNALKVVG